MTFRIKFNANKAFSKLIAPNDRGNYISAVRKEFANNSPVKIKQAIMQDIIVGVSPVKGKGKYKKYSESYKDVIRGKATFRRGKNGKVYKSNKPDKEFLKNSNPTKSVSPVNLRHSGDLHHSFSVKASSNFFSAFRIVFTFAHYLADIHNRRGAGKAKVIRRLLPSNEGEQLNKKINDVILAQLRKAVEKVVQKIR